MNVIRLSVFVLLLAPLSAVGQDMPLSQILPDGTGWALSKEKPFKAHSLPGALEEKEAFASRAGADGPWFATFPGMTGIQRVTEEGAWTMQLPLGKATGVVAWPGGGTVVVGDADGRDLWAFRVTEKGDLVDGEPYYRLRLNLGQEKSGVRGLAVDPVGRVYAATPLGVQVFDTTGRMSGVLLKPGKGELTHVRVYVDREPPILSAICGGKRYDRPLKAGGLKVGPKR